MTNFKEVTISTDTAVCNHCKKHLPRGSRAVMGFRRDYAGVSTLDFCDWLCLADYKEKRQSAVNRMLNRLNIQFN